MGETIVLLHGSANGSYSWGAVQRLLAKTGAKALAPDMLGYGRAPAPSNVWTIDEETRHLERTVDLGAGEAIHLVAHSIGGMFALYLLRALGPRVQRLTLIDPVVVSVLRETGEETACAEMEAQYQRFMSLVDQPAAPRETQAHGLGRTVAPGHHPLDGSPIRQIRLDQLGRRADVGQVRLQPCA